MSFYNGLSPQIRKRTGRPVRVPWSRRTRTGAVKDRCRKRLTHFYDEEVYLFLLPLVSDRTCPKGRRGPKTVTLHILYVPIFFVSVVKSKFNK